MKLACAFFWLPWLVGFVIVWRAEAYARDHRTDWDPRAGRYSATGWELRGLLPELYPGDEGRRAWRRYVIAYVVNIASLAATGVLLFLCFRS